MGVYSLVSVVRSVSHYHKPFGLANATGEDSPKQASMCVYLTNTCERPGGGTKFEAKMLMRRTVQGLLIYATSACRNTTQNITSSSFKKGVHYKSSLSDSQASN